MSEGQCAEGLSSSTVGAVDTIAARRTRREKKKKAGSSALEKIKRSRETGLHEESALEREEELFEYVDDKEYAKIVQQRQEEGFVLDDDGSYCEHGREIFDEEAETDSTSRSKGKRMSGPKRVGKPSANIKNLLMKGKAGEKKKKEESVSVKDDNLLSDILSQYEGGSSGSKSKKRHISNSGISRTSTTPKRKTEFTPRVSSTPHLPAPLRGNRSIGKYTPTSKGRFSKPLPPPSKEEEEGKKEEEEEMKGLDIDDWGGDDWGGEGVEEEVVGGGEGGAMETATMEEAMEVEEKEPQPQVPAEAISNSGWETVREGLETCPEAFSGVQVDSSSLPTHGEEGSEVLTFFWLDAYEDQYRQPGTVFLFGKVWIQEANTHVSCCVTVKNIDRCLYFLPREKVLDSSGHPTDEDVTFESLYREVNSRYADKYRILRFTSKRVTKKYSFDLPSIPQESEYLQVRYSTEYPAPKMEDTGKTFSHVFGTNTSSMERLILTCGLKGPCWLNIKQPMCPANTVSWCKCEAVINSMNAIAVATEQAPPPPLVVMSLSLKITLNPKTGTNEVLCLGSLVHPDIHLDKPPPVNPFKADLLAIRHPIDRDFPFKFEEHVKKKGLNVEVSPSERAMLGYFLAKIHRLDPDIIVGHTLTTFGLEVLAHRMGACKVPQWSRVGRLKRKDMPRGRMIGLILCAGRPVVDLRTSAKELIRAKSYDLGELASTVLHTKHLPMDHEEVVKAFCSNEHLCGVIGHTMDEAMLSLKLMYELNVLALAYQITCIAGNTLGRTLQGGRAERNEFLLLHAFTSRNYICPDKKYGQKKTPQIEEVGEDGQQGGGASGSSRGRKKPAYSGGLVFEPKRGFYDKFILLLDFNSLYPSIMQEYNICFTTLDHAQCLPNDDEAYMKLRLPDSSADLGILPSEIRVLIERRWQVKKLMKTAQGNPDLYTSYDIRQKALKLTANSMYGCLGFSNSRFYAKPLAALITSKGREILLHTKELAQKLNLDVIYGDTDSIMINSNTRDLREAERIAQQVKTEVNKLYRLLEIDIDGIYKTMLLLRKKKYAAVSLEHRDGQIIERRELKGLDIVRRDWSGLAKRSGHYVLDQILSGAPLDDVIEHVQSFLQELRKEIDTDAVPMEEYVISKCLTKAPCDYPDKKNQAHVQVALRMQSRGKHVQAGDTIPYIMCQGESHQPSSLRAYHPEEVSKQSHLLVDKAYYLQHQVHAVVTRLCEPIQGLEPASLAECLGLDASSYRSSFGGQGGDDGEDEVGGGGCVVDPFEGTRPLFITCPKCHNSVELQGSRSSSPPERFSCGECKSPFSTSRILNHLNLNMKSAIDRYYSGWLLCDDQSCGYRSRLPTVCLDDVAPTCPNCRQGKLREEYAASALYRQLTAYEELFKIKDDPRDDIKTIKTHVRNFLDLNMYSKIDLTRLFPLLT